MAFADDVLFSLEREHGDLGVVLKTIAHAVKDTSELLRSGNNSYGEVGTTNTFGDKQLQVDLVADDILFRRLRECGAVEMASSEEKPDEIHLGGKGFSVAFDPLDGSSIVGANFAVGAIFGVWKGCGFLHRTGSQQVAAAYAVYGPRTSLVIALPATAGSSARTVREYTLAGRSNETWKLSRENIRIGEKKVFAPANLRAAADNPAYMSLVSDYIAWKYTLRYTGGFVPDVHHILTKGGGVFINPTSASAPAKLRLLYECAPLAFIVESAGGQSSNGADSLLHQIIESLDVRTAICLGSASEVEKGKQCLHA